MKKYPKRIGLRLENETYEKLKCYAEVFGLSVSWVVRQTLRYGTDAVMNGLKERWEIEYNQLKREGKL